MIGIELSPGVDGQKVWEELLRRGYILNLTQGSVLRLLPPLIIGEADLRRFAKTLGDVLSGM
jgi:acetylornithine aminotransferase